MRNLFSVLLCLCANVTWGSEPLNIVTTIKPVHSIVSAITDGISEPVFLVKGNKSPHDFSPKPSDIRKIAQADVIFYIGEELEFFMGKYLKSKHENATVVRLLSINDLHIIKNAANDEGHHDHDHSHANRDAVNNIDPHIWLSPDNAAIMARHVADVLSKKDAANKNIYQENYNIFKEKLQKASAEIKHKLQKHISKPYILTHNAYRYFESFYGLKSVGIVVASSAESINAKNLSEVSQSIRAQNIKCLFAEPSSSKSAIKAIKLSNNISVFELDPLGSKIKAGKNAYLGIINNISDNLIECLAQ